MSWRKGYSGERKAKQELEAMYGKLNVIKVAISQFGADFLVFEEGEMMLIVEVKETTKIKYSPLIKEKHQFERIMQFAKLHKCPAELWIYYKRGFGTLTGKEVRSLN